MTRPVQEPSEQGKLATTQWHVRQLERRYYPSTWRLVGSGLVDPRTGRPVRVDAPEIHSTADLKPASEALTSAVLSGELTPQEGSDAARVLVAHGNMVELVDVDERLTVLEEKHAKAQQR